MVGRGWVIFQKLKVTVNIYASLILALLTIQVCKSPNVYCPEAVKSVKVVVSCPTSKEEWEKAANKKNCKNDAAQQNCTSANLFLYHCVINGYGNETLEVCAPRRIISGFCTEFNVVGGVIQVHASAKCNNRFPKCGLFYFSTDAYKYQDCYDFVKKTQILNKTTATQLELTAADKTLQKQISIFIVMVCLLVIVFCGSIVYDRIYLKQPIDRPEYQTKENGHSIPIPNQDYHVPLNRHTSTLLDCTDWSAVLKLSVYTSLQ
uniref:Uncharacterized protein n=1 Tax=Magallana gigas TaxID=29159 RepID=A0A8W8JCJ5_MAGGI